MQGLDPAGMDDSVFDGIVHDAGDGPGLGGPQLAWIEGVPALSDLDDGEGLELHAGGAFDVSAGASTCFESGDLPVSVRGTDIAPRTYHDRARSRDPLHHGAPDEFNDPNAVTVSWGP